MEYHCSPSLILREDRRYLGTQNIEYEPSIIRITSNHHQLSTLCFLLALISALLLPLMFLLKGDDPRLSFLYFICSCFVAISFVAGLQLRNYTQTTLFSTLAGQVHFFTKKKLRLKVPFSQIQRTELKKYALGQNPRYVVSIFLKDNKRISLFEGEELQKARMLCENLSKFLRLPLLDCIERKVELREIDQLDQNIATQIQKHFLDPSLKLSIQVQEQADGYHLEDRNASQQGQAFLLLLSGVVLLTLILFAAHQAFTSGSKKDFEQASNLVFCLIPFAVTALGLIGIGFSLFSKKACLVINSQNIRCYQQLFGVRYQEEEIPLNQIEDIALQEGCHGFREIKIISDQKVITLRSNHFGTPREMFMIKTVIANLVLKFLDPQGKKYQSLVGASKRVSSSGS
jgi:hypothetical protein